MTSTLVHQQEDQHQLEALKLHQKQRITGKSHRDGDGDVAVLITEEETSTCCTDSPVAITTKAGAFQVLREDREQQPTLSSVERNRNSSYCNVSVPASIVAVKKPPPSPPAVASAKTSTGTEKQTQDEETPAPQQQQQQQQQQEAPPPPPAAERPGDTKPIKNLAELPFHSSHRDNNDNNHHKHQSQQERHSTKQLDWSFLKSGLLYGRDKEIEQLQQAFHKRLIVPPPTAANDNNNNNDNNKPELVLVSGASGTGKSALVKQALQRLATEEFDGYYLVGKFDQLFSPLFTPQPYGPFVAALTQLATHLEQAHFQGLHQLRQRLVTAVASREACELICSLVPAFRRILGQDSNPKENESFPDGSSSNHHQDRLLKMALKKMLAAVSSKDEPVVLVLDDLQWADHASLSLLESLVAGETTKTTNAAISSQSPLHSSPIIEGFMVVGICRSNEVPWHHCFAGMLRRLEDVKNTTINHIVVQNLPLEATNQLISDVLQTPALACRHLAEMIHQTSQGNVFFILQYLKTLYQEGVLVAERVSTSTSSTATSSKSASSSSASSSSTYQWLWHDDQWDGAFQNTNVVELVSYQIKRLPESCQRLLKVAACIGAEFDAAMMTKLFLASSSNDEDSNRVDVPTVVALAVEEQMIVPQMHRPGKYAFNHDRIQQAAYSLIPENELAMTHVSIGRHLLEIFSGTEVDDNLFLLVNQLIFGIPLLTTEVDKNGLAALCLQAGIKASRASDFETALVYFNTGKGLLGQRHWRDEYHLSLELFNRLAESQAACADYESMDNTIQEIIANCRTDNDKVQAYLTRIHSLGARTRFDEAIAVSLEVMRNLGELFPKKPRLIYLIPELIRVKRRLHGKSDQDILNLPDIEDKSKLAAVITLHYMALYVFLSNPDLFPFVVLRTMKLTLKHGFSDASPQAMTAYGMVLCAAGEYDEGYRYGQLGLQLLERNPYTRSKWLPRVYFTVYAAINPWKRPLRETFDKLQVAISTGMDGIDFECSVFTSYTSAINAYIGGERLTVLDERLEQYLEFIQHFKQGPWLALTLMFRRFCHNAMGKNENPLLLEFVRDGNDSQQECLWLTEDDKFSFQLLESTMNINRLALAFHLGDLELALSCAKPVQAAENTNKAVIMIVYQYLFDGLTSFEAAHHKSRRQHMAHGHKVLKKLEKLSNYGPFNTLHRVYILRGELQVLKGNLAKAMEWYEKAIDHAASQQQDHLHALAYERAAIAHQRLGDDPNEARRLMKRAIELYELWGAMAFVSHLKKKHNL